MIVCKKCGFRNAETEPFCASCGSFLEWSGERVGTPRVDDSPKPGPGDTAANVVTPTEATPAGPPAAGGGKFGTPPEPEPVPEPQPEPAPAEPVPAPAPAEPVRASVEPSLEPRPVPAGSTPVSVPAPPPAATPTPTRKPAAARPRGAPKEAQVVEEARPDDIICVACQTANPPSRRFCRHCGAELAVPAPAPVEVSPPPRRKLPASRVRMAAMAAGVCGVLVLVAAGSYMLTSAVTKNPATPTPRVTDGPSANTTPTTVRGTGTWTNGKPLDVPVWGAAGILLDDGRVLMAGGTAAENSKSAVATAKIIDSSGGWAGVPNMAAPRAYPMSVKLRDGSVLVAGGLSNSVPLASAERFDPSTNTWTSAGTMTVARVHATATLLNDGRVLVAGGGVEGPPNYRATNTAEIYDPNTGKWTATAPMKSARSLHVAALLPSGDVLVAGGGDRFAGDAKVSAAAEIYSPLTRAWRDAAPMAAAREGHCAVAMKSGLVLVLGSLAGGPNAASLPSAEVYEWQNNRWLAVDSMATGRGQFRATLLFDGRVMAVGGVSSQGTMLDTVELYSPATKRWVQSGAMPAPAMWPILITLQDGRVLVAGGATKPDGGSPSGMVAIFDPPNQ